VVGTSERPAPSPAAIAAATVAFPPLGLGLLWARSGLPVWKRLALTIPIVVVGAAWAHLVLSWHVVLDGSGRPRVAFTSPARHYAALEQQRAAQGAQFPAPASAALPAREDATPANGPPLAGRASEPDIAVAPESAGDAAIPPAAAAASPVQAAAVPAGARSGFWTDFRGPRRDGHYTEQRLALPWPATGPREMWRQPLGAGYASFVVAGERLFTIEQRRQQEVVAAYATDTGRELWTHAWDATFREFMGGDGPRATPTWHDGRLYALGATGELRAFDAETGRVVWSRNILDDNGAANLQWGMAAAPLVVDDLVVVHPGGAGGRSVVAYHRVTGEPVWRALDDQAAYASPMVVTLAGERQVLLVSASRAMGLEVEDGTVLWEYPWTTMYNVNAAQPLVVGDRRVFLSSGYGKGAAVIEVTREGGGFRATTVWGNIGMKNRFSSSVLHDGVVYGLDEGILAAVDVATGERKWKAGRYGHGQLLLAGGYLLVLTEDGDLVLVRATPDRHDEISRASSLSGKTWNVPALDGGRLFVRNTTEMAAYDLRPE
jgi:outer membrane protein assembly factor BamB